MEIQQCYRILGVSENASEIQIKRAYRSKAKLYHPDTNRSENAKLQFQLLNEVYHQILDHIHQKSIVDTSSDSSEADYKKYGTSIRNKSYHSASDKKETYYSEKEEDSINRSPYDKYIYWFFLAIGINMLVYAILDIFKHEEDGSVYYNGLFAAIPFLVLLIIGWRLLKRDK